MLNEKYKALSTPPATALKTIGYGALKGKSEINPQWKLEAMTEQYGMCGIGWKFDIADKTIYPVPDGQVLLYMQVNLYIKDGEQWSEPVVGYGGDFIIIKNKNGLVPSDEAFKCCLTDALGNAMKCLGVAANVYRGFCDTKYSRPAESPKPAATPKPAAQPSALNITSTSANGCVRYINGIQCQVKDTRGDWHEVELLSIKALEQLLADDKYADAAEAIKATIAAKSVAK